MSKITYDSRMMATMKSTGGVKDRAKGFSDLQGKREMTSSMNQEDKRVDHEARRRSNVNSRARRQSDFLSSARR